METAIRWSPHATQDNPRFLILDVAGNRLRLCQVEAVEQRKVRYKQLTQRDKLPSYTAFDWSKTQEHLVALGTASGEASLVHIDAERPQLDFIHSFNIKHQRKCNSIAFSTKDYLATGLDRVRNDFCMNIYDLNSQTSPSSQEPYKKLASSEAISSIKFFSSQPDTLIAGVSRQCIRLYDLRDSNGGNVAQYNTRQVHNLAIDPLDENYFVSAGPAGDPVVSVWDRRFAARSSPGTPYDGPPPNGPVLEFKPAMDNSQNSTIWTLRFTGSKRGAFGILANSGEVKIVEMAQHTMKTTIPTGPSNQHGGYAWNSHHYTKATHTLQKPWYAHENPDESARIVAFDFMPSAFAGGDQCALGLHTNREIELLKIPSRAPQIRFNAWDELYKNQFAVAKPSPHHGSVAEDLDELKSVVKDLTHMTLKFGKINVETPGEESGVIDRTPLTSRQAHERLLTMGFPEIKLQLPDTLKLLGVQKRRCQEGYNLDCRRNKEVVANDHWLVELWDLISRLESLAQDGGMIAEALDLSYLGVASIWLNNIGPKRNERRLLSKEPATEARIVNAVKTIGFAKELPAFRGVNTKYPEHRQLCLTICKWNLAKSRLREQCMELMDRKEYYKAIVLAVFMGHKDLALDLLRWCVQNKFLSNVGLGAVIACDSVNEQQREMCSWMAEETEDPYLKSLLAYFISGTWTSVTSMSELCLNDRVGVALRYLDDETLTSFLKAAQADVVFEGDIEGILLTGLTEPAMTLFEHYIAKFGDLQTAVLAMARTNPLYISDPRWECWKTTYFFQMQVWRAFHERTRFIAQHNMRSVSRQGRPLNKAPISPQVTIRCTNCQLSLAQRGDQLVSLADAAPPSVAPVQARKPRGFGPGRGAGLCCPKCGAQMPRCGLCMMPVGSPDPGLRTVAEQLKAEDPLARQMVFCMRCTHGFHGHHARDWFAKHQMCPVPDCQCMCGLLR